MSRLNIANVRIPPVIEREEVFDVAKGLKGAGAATGRGTY
jgi:hypothetical protein